MLRAIVLAMALLPCWSAVWAQEKAKEEKTEQKKPSTPAEQFAALQGEYQKAQSEFFLAYQKATTDEERQAVVAEKSPDRGKYASRILELAEKNAEDPVAFEALLWIVSNVRTGDQPARAVEIFTKDHIENEKLSQVCARLIYSPSPASELLLRAALEKSPHEQVRGTACYSLAKYLKQQLRLVEYFKSQPEIAPQIEVFYGKELGTRLQSLDPEKINQEIEDLLAQTIESYAEVEVYGRTLGDLAKGELFEIRHLSVGKVAPEIEGEDIDGVAFNLGDYRGKVVVLDFWGNW